MFLIGTLPPGPFKAEPSLTYSTSSKPEIFMLTFEEESQRGPFTLKYATESSFGFEESVESTCGQLLPSNLP